MRICVFIISTYMPTPLNNSLLYVHSRVGFSNRTARYETPNFFPARFVLSFAYASLNRVS